MHALACNVGVLSVSPFHEKTHSRSLSRHSMEIASLSLGCSVAGWRVGMFALALLFAIPWKSRRSLSGLYRVHRSWLEGWHVGHLFTIYMLRHRCQQQLALRFAIWSALCKHVHACIVPCKHVLACMVPIWSALCKHVQRRETFAVHAI